MNGANRPDPTAHPLVRRDRRLGRSGSEWVRSFSCEDMGVLIVGRGPVRKEAMDVFREMGMARVGILLSERDSIVFPRALAPELRLVEPERVHRVPDYTGATKEERLARMGQIVDICRAHGYGHVFAGYGFMAEDAEFVRALERAGLVFVGPCSAVQEAAGRKDEAKRTALRNGVSVTPGVNNATARTLLRRCPDVAALEAEAARHGLAVPALAAPGLALEERAEALLEASYARGVDLYTMEELAATLRDEAAGLLARHAGARLRLKAIGGGGGKGQRLVSEAGAVPGLVREILQEVKTTGAGDNKNILLELNVEVTRHNEIQMLGNGDWSVTLGGRDCSLQMHEQKLVEVSLTLEGLQSAITAARRAGRADEARSLETELATLQAMESEAERFGSAVGLDSAATFECIIDGPNHYLMEVNTRIQVEHRVSELCYALRFRNPSDPGDFFDVHSLVEAMALIARHGRRLPRPARILREGAALEVRLNATDRALAPHAGGVVVGWSDPIPGEIRDDQGICLPNPDTGLFMRYRLAGAYDSNIALLLATGADRAESYRRCAELLRCTTLRGQDLATNLEFLHGLVTFFVFQGVWAKPNTRFVTGYLTLVGQLRREAEAIDLLYAAQQMYQQAAAAAKADGPEVVEAHRRALELKETLILRPIARLLEEPHRLSAWLSEHRDDVVLDERGRARWLRNPMEVLAATYHSLHMLDQPGAPAAYLIWDHDRELMERALGFYRRLSERLASPLPWPELDARLRGGEPLPGFDAELWRRVCASHAGFQAGFEVLAILPWIGRRAGFHELRVQPDLTVDLPAAWLDPEHHAAMRRVLVPPPAMKSDEIVAVTGGIYYAQEAPGLPQFVENGSHFDKGDPLYIVEVMKMFNKVTAPFAGTIDRVLVPESGSIIQKGQPLFKVTPDERVVIEDRATRTARIRAATDACLADLCG